MTSLALARRRFLAGLPAVLAVPGGGTWPVGSLPLRFNDRIAPDGPFLPAANMTLQVASGLNNGTRNQTIGTATCAGLDPVTTTWSFQNIDNIFLSIPGWDRTLFNLTTLQGQGIAAATLTCPKFLSARPEGHTVVLTAKDGQKTCIRSFTFTSSWRTPGVPNLFVGRGMLAAKGSNIGYEHWSDLLPRLVQSGSGLPDELQGTEIVWMPDSDRDYYGEDNASGRGGFADNQSTRFGLIGTFRMRSADPAGPRVRVGGLWGSPSGGMEQRGAGFFNCYDGEQVFSGFEVAFVQGFGSPTTDNSHGVTGIRKNANCVGDITLENSEFHDCNNGFESGTAPYKNTIRNCIFYNNGGQTIGSGQTHAVYADGSVLVYENNRSFNNNIGHDLKTRCVWNEIRDSVLADGTNGSASQCINLPNGGYALIERNVLHKGPSQQNPYLIGLAEDRGLLETYQRSDLRTIVRSNTFIDMGVLGAHSGPSRAASFWPFTSTTNGARPTLVLENNRYFSINPAFAHVDYPYSDPAQSAGLVSETGAVTLAKAPALDLSDPGTAMPKAKAPGFFNDLFYYGGDSYVNFDHCQVKSDVLDIHVAASAAAATVLTVLRPYGAQFYQNDSPTSPLINPFKTAGANTWSITTDPEYFPGAVWAPTGMFALVPSADKLTAELRVGTGLAAGTYLIKVRIVGGGVTCDKRLYVVVV